VEPDYLSIKEWTVRKGELFAAGDERHMARVVLLGASAARDLLAQWAAQPRVFDQASAWLAVGVATVLNSGFAAIPARGVARLDPIQALRFE
jgi:ABC-type antimicrobial peptide transport system permease subunit